jgi:hypothetical protein
MKYSIRVAFAFIALPTVLGLPMLAVAQELYKSKDASGSTVYSDKPPNTATSATRLVIRATAPAAAVPSTQSTNKTAHAEPSQEQLAAYKRRQQLPENRCKWLRDQLEMMRPDPRAKYAEVTFEDGKTLVFGTPEFQNKARALEAEAAEVCGAAVQ